MQGSAGAQLAAFQPQPAFQEHIALPHAGPSLSQHASPDPFARFLDRSSICAPYDSLPGRCSLQDATSSATPPLRALDVPPSLSGFRSIAGGHSHCDWSDTLPFLLPHYSYSPASDKTASALAPFCINLPEPSAAMSAPPPDATPSYPGTSSASPHTTGTAASSSATGSDITQSIRNACANNSRSASSRTSKQEGTGPRPREKKHSCWMCEKSFDRPSTLRKHLLVHTGEKAFVCDTCGRRFGVASNLNRHVKRCILKPVNAANRAPQMSSANTITTTTAASSVTPPSVDAPPALRISTAASDTAPPLPPTTGPVRSSHKRARGDDAGTTSPPDSPTRSTPKPPTKRRRRAPSPSQWIPQSLADFNITPAEYIKPTPVPLPPVTAYKDPSSDEWIEERNSWDENVGLLPYHPCGWKGTLPGPGIGLGGKDVINLGLVNGGTYVMGRLVMV